MSSNVAQIYEHSSRRTPTGNADPYWILLRTLDVHSTDIAMVVKGIRDLLTIAQNMDDELRPLLLADIDGYIEALISLSSVNGKGVKALTTLTQAYHIKESSSGPPKMGMREMISGQKQEQQKEVGIPVES